MLAVLLSICVTACAAQTPIKRPFDGARSRDEWLERALARGKAQEQSDPHAAYARWQRMLQALQEPNQHLTQAAQARYRVAVLEASSDTLVRSTLLCSRCHVPSPLTFPPPPPPLLKRADEAAMARKRALELLVQEWTAQIDSRRITAAAVARLVQAHVGLVEALVEGRRYEAAHRVIAAARSFVGDRLNPTLAAGLLRTEAAVIDCAGGLVAPPWLSGSSTNSSRVVSSRAAAWLYLQSLLLTDAFSPTSTAPAKRPGPGKPLLPAFAGVLHRVAEGTVSNLNVSSVVMPHGGAANAIANDGTCACPVVPIAHHRLLSMLPAPPLRLSQKPHYSWRVTPK